MARRDTPELILSTSLALFNAHGEPATTTNHIALEADISPGNLYYHFRSKDDIVIALFKRFLGRLEPLLSYPQESPLDTEELWLRLHLMFEVKGDYRFLYRNLTDLVERIGDLRKAVRALARMERDATLELIDRLSAQGVLHLQAGDREALADSTLLLMNWWIPHAQVLGVGQVDGQAQGRAVARVLHLFAPYLDETEAERIRTLAAAYLDA